MHIQSRISALALVVAMAAVPAPAFAQLNLGIDLGLGADDGGLGLGAGVDLGIGDQNLNVDAGVRVGGDSLVDADVNIGGSGADSSGGISVDAEVLGEDGLVDADVNIGGGASAAPATPASTPPASSASRAANPLVDLRISALDETARVDALIGRIASPDLAGLDLDDAIDDTRVSIVTLADLLGAEDAADVRARIEAGGAGRDELIAAIDASVELGSILARNGLSSEDVVALTIDANGGAELVVVDLDIDLADAEDGRLLDTDLAALDIALLSDEELAGLDLALLPNEEQRLDAIVRILGNGGGSEATGGDIELVDVDALLGQESLAELDATLGGSEAESVLITADLLNVLDDAGLSPEAVIGVDTRPDRPTRVFVNAGLGDGSLIAGDLAQVDLSIGTGSTGGGGTAGGDTGDGETGNGGTDPGTGQGPGDDNGNGNGDGSDNGAGGNGGNGSGTGSGGSTTGPSVTVPAVSLEVDAVVAEVSCAAGLGALSAAPLPEPSDLRNIAAVNFVAIEGCAAILRQDELAALRAAIAARPELRQSIDRAGLALEDLVGGTLENRQLTLYFDARDTTAARGFSVRLLRSPCPHGGRFMSRARPVQMPCLVHVARSTGGHFLGQPIAEQPDLPGLPPAGGGGQEIAALAAHRQIKGPDQSAVTQHVRCHHVRGQEHALSGYGGIKGQRGIGQNRPVQLRLGVEAGCGQPQSPIEHTGRILDHRHLEKVRRLLDFRAEQRRTDRLEILPPDQRRHHAGPDAVAKPDAAVDIGTAEIEHRAGHGEAHFQPRMQGRELVHPPDQPARGKDAPHGHIEHALMRAREVGQPILQLRKAGAELRQHLGQRGQRLEPLRGARKQLQPQPLLGPPQMLAHCANRHAQLFGRGRKRPATGDDLDRAQRVEGNGEGLAHIDFL